MFSSLNLFSAIECPEAQNCRLPRCLFYHSSPLQNASLDGPEGNCEEPRKKRKTSADDEKPLASLERPVTPPPVRTEVPTKKAILKPRPSVRKAEMKSVPAEVPKQSPKPAPGPVPGPIQSPQCSKEALNPRQLAKSPAQHSSRLLYVKALHDQYHRLNEEHINSANGPLYSAQELITMTLDEEEKVAREKPLIYGNVIKHRIVALRKMSLEDWKKELSAKVAKTKKEASESVNGKAPEPIITGLSPQEEQKLL